ncbi:DNA polymerase III subunit delta' [Vibrio azureus]|uniref:DNA polymerase III subunit delta' n=1 Tax=Vibrio azureus NBRC 104587 TaxID=1219077 RepID=U3ALA2_9VIBR|nr:DNA polymerase III subunit delta' [Vibrio azureus]AUI86465.1 DNA polymerase III subunit delta' [Vibrio azureus]GAD74077.1 DNA polymerase III subunit delta' [Vibrio azureus NBRC 104587]
MLNDYPWLEPVWTNLKTSLELDRISGALLFHTNKGLGTEKLVEALSHALLCQNDKSEACGFCHSCQLVQSQSHPDLHWVKPEKEGKSITVDQIRLANRLAQESAQLNGYRVFIIAPADAMNESASNALLKTLEEPGENCVFLLLTEHQEHLLPTIKSRCQKWTVTTPSTQQAIDWLNQHTQNTIPDYALKLNMGSPLAALAALEEGELEAYLKFENCLIDALLSPNADLFHCASLFSQYSNKALDWAWLLLSDAQKVHFGLTVPEQLPGAVRFTSAHYNGLHRSANKLLELKQQFHRFSGLNLELLSINWLIESREELCS